jgi:hypothetical protein
MLFLCSSVANRAAAQCDENYVRLTPGAGAVVVEPTGLDDSSNLSCALELVRDRQLLKVSLSAGEYFVDGVQISNFRGILQGAGRESTIVRGLAEPRECEADGSLSRINPAAITFLGGEPIVRYVSFYAGRACDVYESILQFTADTVNDGSCTGSGVINASIDRTDLYAGADYNAESAAYGIRVAPQGRETTGCRDKLRGSFSARFSSFSGFKSRAAILVSMHSGARVDVSNSDFRDNVSGVSIERAFVDANFSFNTFVPPPLPPGEEPSEQNASHSILTTGSEPTIDGVSRLSFSSNAFRNHPFQWCVPLFGDPVVAIFTGNLFTDCGVVGRPETGFLSNNLASGDASFGLGNTTIQGNRPQTEEDTLRIDLLGGSTVGVDQGQYIGSVSGENYFAQ